jgi:transposase
MRLITDYGVRNVRWPHGLVVAVACLFTCYGRADLCTPEDSPFVLGHARSLKAMHGGQATNDPLDSHKLAPLLRGGRRPPASVSPAERRATRDLLRRRTPLMRQRAERLAQVQHTHAPYTLPALGQNIAYTATRAGVAERCADPAVHKTIAVDLDLLT